MKLFVAIVLLCSLMNGTQGVWTPAPGTTFQLQLGGDQINLNVSAKVYDIDLEVSTDSDISTLHR